MAELMEGKTINTVDGRYCFDNFSSFPVYYLDYKWPTTEHAYQATKFVSLKNTCAEHTVKIHRKIKKAEFSHHVKNIAYTYEDFVREDWCDELRLEIMEKLLRLKLSQHLYVRSRLFESRNIRIIGGSNQHSFWGHGKDPGGGGNLEMLWLKIRTDLLKGDI